MLAFHLTNFQEQTLILHTKAVFCFTFVLIQKDILSFKKRKIYKIYKTSQSIQDELAITV